MKLYTSALGYARKLNFRLYFRLYMNKIFQYRHARVILFSVGEIYIFESGLYISRMFILSNYVLLAFITNF